MTQKQYTLGELAQLTQSSLKGPADFLITGVDALDTAGSTDASFLANPLYLPLLKTTQAGVVCISPNTPMEEDKNYLLSENPSETFQTILAAFSAASQSGFEGIHPTAIIHPTVQLGIHVSIGPYVVIDQGTLIGDHTQIHAHTSIGPGVTIGKECCLFAHVTVRENCTLGNRVILQPGCVIGSCGFGYTTDAKGRHHKLEQLGAVVIEDDVEVGANTTIDRARFKRTRIRRGTKIDNLVQIGHNVTLGEDNLIVAQTGIAGSSKTGKNVVFGGQAAAVGHVEIADYSMIAARGGVSKSVLKPGGKYAGSPMMELADYNRQKVHLRKIASYVEEIETLKKRVKALEQQP